MTIRLHLPNGETIVVDKRLIVGRLPECDVVIADSLVSGNHFEIGPAPGGAQIIDLDSSNGTYVNGDRVTAPRVLTGGEEIAVGSQKVTVERVVEVKPADLRIAVRVGADTGLSVELLEGGTLVVGRADDAGLNLTDPLVSSRHVSIALVRPPAGPCPHCGMLAQAGDAHCIGCGHQRVAAEVHDLGSANGTLVDGAAVAPNGRADLLEGGEIQIGDSVLTFVDLSKPAKAGPAPTVIRSTPAGLVGSAPHAMESALAASVSGVRAPTHAPAMSPGGPKPTPLPPPTGKSTRLSPVIIGSLVAGAAILLLLIVIVVTRGSGDSSSSAGQIHDAAWVRTEKGSATVQVLAEQGSSGSGFSGSGSVFDSSNGLVLSNFHVFSDEYGSPLDSMRTYVRADGSDKWLDATLIGYNACEDLAVLQINSADERSGLGQVQLGSRESIIQGATVVALGFPGTLESQDGALEQMSLTQGVISKPSVTTVKPYPDLVQIDADLNHGNSGGPLFNLDGIQVGVNTLGDADGTQGIFYAISSVRVNQILPNLKAGEKQSTFNSCPS